MCFAMIWSYLCSVLGQNLHIPLIAYCKRDIIVKLHPINFKVLMISAADGMISSFSLVQIGDELLHVDFLKAAKILNKDIIAANYV